MEKEWGAITVLPLAVSFWIEVVWSLWRRCKGVFTEVCSEETARASVEHTWRTELWQGGARPQTCPAAVDFLCADAAK